MGVNENNRAGAEKKDKGVKPPETTGASAEVIQALRRNYQDEVVARTYEEERDFREGDVSLHYETEVLALSEALGGVRGEILEVAVGTGRLCRRLRRFGGGYTGLDVSMQMLSEAKKAVCRDANGPWLVRGDAFQLPFKDNHFEAVVGFRFIKHIGPDGRKVIYTELRRVLDDDGLLLFDFYGWRRRSAKKTDDERLTVGALRSEVEENGFRLIKVYGTRHMVCDVVSVPFRWLKIRSGVRAAGWLGVKMLSPLDEFFDRSRGGIAVCKKL